MHSSAQAAKTVTNIFIVLFFFHSVFTRIYSAVLLVFIMSAVASVLSCNLRA